MGAHDQVVQPVPALVPGRFLLEDVQACAVDAILFQGVQQGGAVHQFAAGGIDEDGGGPHQGQARGIDHPPGAVVEDGVQADEVGFAEDAFQTGAFDPVLSGPGLVPAHVVAQHLHAEARAAAAGHAPADGAQADDAHGLAVEVDAGDLAPVLPAAAAVDEGHLAGHAQHQGQGVVGHGLAVGAHGAGDLDAPGLAGGQVDIVQAHAVPGDGPEFGRGGQHAGVDRVHAQDQAFAVGQFFAHLGGGEDAAGIVAQHFQSGVAQDVEEFGIVFAEGSRRGENFHAGLLAGRKMCGKASPVRGFVNHGPRPVRRPGRGRRPGACPPGPVLRGLPAGAARRGPRFPLPCVALPCTMREKRNAGTL